MTPRVSTDGGLLPADGAALRARMFPSPWCSVCGVELMFGGRVASANFLLHVPIASFSLDGASRRENLAYPQNLWISRRFVLPLNSAKSFTQVLQPGRYAARQP